jgi:DNA-binding transcriptional MocR family regulator
MLCSSFSKTLAPGYRVGWIVPGRYEKDIARLKPLFNIATATPTQLAIADFLSGAGYDRHLRAIRRTLSRQAEQMRECVLRCFPAGTKVSSPAGGYFLWVEMPEGTDSYNLYRRARSEGIGIAPGMLFSLGDGFKNCIRLNTSFWSPPIEQALKTVGRLAGR